MGRARDAVLGDDVEARVDEAVAPLGVVTAGAGSVVTRDLPANVVAVGNPARVIRESI